MATTHSLTVLDTAAPTPSASALARWPVYATAADAVDGVTYGAKERLILDLMGCIGGHQAAVADVIQRLSNSDTSTWTDKGSRAL